MTFVEEFYNKKYEWDYNDIAWMYYIDKLQNVCNFYKNDKKLLKYIKNNYKGKLWYHMIAGFLTNNTAGIKYQTNEEGVVINVSLDGKPYIGNYSQLYRFWEMYLPWAYGEENNKFNFLKNTINCKKISLNKREKYIRKNGIIKTRPMQSKIRKRLLDKHQCCQLSGLDNSDYLEYCHIKEYSKCNAIEAIDFNNGLLLYSGYHKLFDKGEFSFDDYGNILLTDSFCREFSKVSNIYSDVKIDVSPGQKKYLKWHRENIFKG